MCRYELSEIQVLYRASFKMVNVNCQVSEFVREEERIGDDRLCLESVQQFCVLKGGKEEMSKNSK